MVKEVKSINKKSILTKPNKKSGKTISEACKNVYGNFIRLMNIHVVVLVKKNVSVYSDGLKCHKQRGLLLINLKEFHSDFLRTTDYQVSFLTFCQLRPKCCVTVDSSSGVHSVCVCEIH